MRLSRQNVGQRPLDVLYFFTNHPDRLLMGGVRHGRNGGYRVTNLIVPIPNLVYLRKGQHSALVDPFSQLRHNPGESQPEHHFDWQPVGCAIEIEEREPIDGFAETKRSEYHSHPNQSERKAIKRSKLERRLIIATIVRD